jgi:hypothetical protein
MKMKSPYLTFEKGDTRAVALSKQVAQAVASELLIQDGKLAQSHRHSSGHSKKNYKVVKGFLHWKVVEQ